MKTLLIQVLFMVLPLASWLNRHQQDAVDYLREENRILRAKIGPRRLDFTDCEWRRLAIVSALTLPEEPGIGDAKDPRPVVQVESWALTRDTLLRKNELSGDAQEPSKWRTEGDWRRR